MPTMTNSNPLQAANPAVNASVHASAGTGKTWLLTTRIIRLLLGGARPDSILAVTFTRKAAAEMQQRITERLREFMQVPAEDLDKSLEECGIEASAETRVRVRQLYEELLYDPYPLRTTTFHAFCQELLQRFPLEAGIDPGFEIIESTGLLEQAAWDALIADTAREPDSPLAATLDILAEACNGLGNTRTALHAFLAHRSDWWAYCQGEPRAWEHAVGRLENLLGIESGAAPLAGFPDRSLRTQLQEFAALLGRNTTQTNTKHADRLAGALAGQQQGKAFLEAVMPVFFGKEGKPYQRKASGVQGKRLGAEGEQRFLELHDCLVQELAGALDRLARDRTLQTNRAWYFSGARLLEHYQRIKREQRLLDFADLEWFACELLNRSDHASWVQYKLDTRIDHLLVDEFQDTNPTQWRLLLPLLQELAAGTPDRQRTVFLVGDEKQSIYGFRRANPALMAEASGWLDRYLDAGRYPLDASRRSAQAIMDCVNSVFGSAPLNRMLTGFNTHTTHHPDDYGLVEIMPLIANAVEKDRTERPPALRNPLVTPRRQAVTPAHYAEGEMIAGRIRDLMNARTPIAAEGTTRPLRYSDVMILLRQRTHSDSYEQALRNAGIPYHGAGKSELLDNLEVRDLDALLNLLVSPYDNLALAQVLHSPIFNLTSEQLVPLARLKSGNWYERLAALAADKQAPFADAYRQLEQWRDLAGKLPVHDLLDRIFHEGEIMQRYGVAFPPALVPGVLANLTRFIELALEVDNGRYPSLPRFLYQLERLRQSDQDQPTDGAPADAEGDRVRILTIHGAKGLESPVVFLADATVKPGSRAAYDALVDWPSDCDRPQHYLLALRQDAMDSASRALLESQQLDLQRESANLLYVAMTRARQYLFISGCEPSRGTGLGWYGAIETALAGWERSASGSLIHESGSRAGQQDTREAAATPMETDPRLAAPVPAVTPDIVLISPSRTTEAATAAGGDPDGRERGTTIHLMLEKLSGTTTEDPASVYRSIASLLERTTDDSELHTWWQEAMGVYRNPAFAFLFDAGRFQTAYSELPMQYMEGRQLIYGIIDRLVVTEEYVHLIDYKTHRITDNELLTQLTDQYRRQLELYASGAARIWPHHRIKPCLLFTHTGALFDLSGECQPGPATQGHN
ncbi:MAG: UvrD-helicase domain-containing protein [Gammaproteobacteria bacterium]|nr:MAG: UvrD-helicase domain-containing protein [Gammaproteobacteria bacterium]